MNPSPENEKFSQMLVEMAVPPIVVALANAYDGQGVFTIDTGAERRITCRSSLEGLPVTLTLTPDNAVIPGLVELIPPQSSPTPAQSAIAAAVYALAFETARRAPEEAVAGA